MNFSSMPLNAYAMNKTKNKTFSLSIASASAVVVALLLSACGGGGGSAPSSNTATPPTAVIPTPPVDPVPPVIPTPPVVVTPTNNVASVVVDSGPTGSSFNAPFVSVTVCQPGTGNCQTIDHILVDTGSSGLRLVSPGVMQASLSLPAVTDSTGHAMAECAQFVSGYTWGSVRKADVKIAGETASNIPVELIGDSGSIYANTPTSCSSSGSNFGTVASLGANGILGIGLFNQDCGQACADMVIPGTYYSCSGSTCSSASLPLENQVSNPVASFAADNNGVVVKLSSVVSSGVPSLNGTLTFGIGTQSNNQVGSATVYKTSAAGNFSTTYKSKTYASSFLDTGSNGLYFPDSSITPCVNSVGFFCPSSPLSLSAVNTSYDSSSSGTVTFSLVAADNMAAGTHAASIGGNSALSNVGSSSFDWGLPFFYGRTVYVAIENRPTTKGSGPYWAY